MKRTNVLLVALVIVALVAASCGGNVPTPTAKATTPAATATSAPTATATVRPTAAPTATAAPKPDRLTVGTGVEPKTLDSALTNSRGDLLAIVNNMEGLVTVTAAMDPSVPALAESWKTVDARTWEFKLRPNVKFHDGTKVTPEDVSYVFERILTPEIKSNWLSNVVGMEKPEVVDASTVRIKTKNPMPTLPQTVARAGISPKAYVQKEGETNAQIKPVGTGPYKFTEWKKSVELRYEAFPDYWGSKASIRTIVFRPIAEDAVRQAAAKTGEIQVAVNIPYDDIVALQKQPNLAIVKQPSLTTFGYIINTTGGPEALKDKRVRQAINHAVDRDLLIREILKGNGVKLQGQPASSLYFGYDDSLKPYDYSLDKAKQLLKDAGYASGFDLPIVFPEGYYVKGKELTEAIAGELSKIGIKPTVQSMEFRAWLTYIQQNGPGVIAHGQNVPPDASFMLQPFLPGGYFKYWQNAQFNDLIGKAATDIDVKARKDLYHQAFTIMREEAPRLELWQVINVYAADSRLTGFQPWADERLWLASVSYK